ncbi:hypothetical protein WG66_005253 [Moniliophthora roreri]|nr:hypothetical protein WG66_005253 [Moniliophthora roreri]
MSQHRRNGVSNAYANRTPCIKHTRVYPGISQGSRRHFIHSACEYTDGAYPCRYSHTAFNAKRVVELGRKNPASSRPTIVQLEYGQGYERYTSHDSLDSGWDVRVNGRNHATGRRWDLPKALLLAELSLGITFKGAPDRQYEKKQSMCLDRQRRSGCQRGDNECKFDHNILDSRRFVSLARAFSGHDEYGDWNYLSVECHISRDGDGDGDGVVWTMVMKPDAFKDLGENDPLRKKMPTNQISLSGSDLLDVLNRLEDFVGLGKK